ncbi:MAG: xanthine dehydrogenase family protein molybdopterin-binding subunit [Proteobacteria bacterium]|nr:xanthine dehydrogenase family protein molybdopterin-binding subunit [Pseudomonadota bacterium]
MKLNREITRRKFIFTAVAGGGGMLLGFHLPLAQALTGATDQQGLIAGQPWTAPTDGAGSEVNAWLLISPDNTVTIRVAQSEMGEGVFTSMPMIVAEELQCDWSQVKAEYASANRSLREDGVYRRMATNGSGAVRRSRVYLQQAGASARERLIQAAANEWQVSATSCTAKDSVVTHAASGRTLSYGALATAAAGIQLAQEPTIKTPDQFTLMGKPLARLDTPLKVNGSAIFGADVRLPDMLFATSKTSPIVGATVKSYDFDAIKHRPGVHSVVEFQGNGNGIGLRSGVAVVADTWWRAKTALELLPIEWDYGPNTTVNSKDIAAKDLQVLNEKTGAVVLDEGAALDIMNTATQVVEAVYSAPHQAHATMEPLGCTAQVKDNRVDIWMGTQGPEGALQEAARHAGVAPENVNVHNCFLGGGFGGRGSRSEVAQAVEIAKTLGGRPVNLLWTREEDMNNDYYNPNPMAKFQAALGPDGMPVAWFNRITSDSIFYWLRPGSAGNSIDRIAVGGLSDMPYQIPNKRIEFIMRNKHVPVFFWRAPGVNHNIFMLESFMDEVALASGADPIEFRRTLLSDSPHLLNVLDKVVDKADWGKSLPEGTAQGFAINDSFGTIVAEIAQVSVSKRGEITVEKIDCALDCGNTVNPLIIEHQVESNIAFALSAALYGEITLKDGRVEQSNFDNYPLLRMAGMPEVKTHFALSGGNKWGGIGEAALPTCAPAVANAIFKVTGKRIRSIPFKHHDLSWG